MPKPDDVGVGTAMLVRDDRGRVLLHLRRGAHRPGHWSAPGGWLDRDDASTERAAIRETLEESGIAVRRATPHLWISEDHPDIGLRTVTLYHLAEPGDWTGTPVVREPDKCARWDWFAPDALPSPLFPGLAEAVARLPARPDPGRQVAELERALAEAADDPHWRDRPEVAARLRDAAERVAEALALIGD